MWFYFFPNDTQIIKLSSSINSFNELFVKKKHFVISKPNCLHSLHPTLKLSLHLPAMSSYFAEALAQLQLEQLHPEIIVLFNHLLNNMFTNLQLLLNKALLKFGCLTKICILLNDNRCKNSGPRPEVVIGVCVDQRIGLRCYPAFHLA